MINKETLSHRIVVKGYMYCILISNKVLGIGYRVKVSYFYFHLATLNYSPKKYGFLINFSLIMLDSPWLLSSPSPSPQSPVRTGPKS